MLCTFGIHRYKYSDTKKEMYRDDSFYAQLGNSLNKHYGFFQLAICLKCGKAKIIQLWKDKQ